MNINNFIKQHFTKFLLDQNHHNIFAKIYNLEANKTLSGKNIIITGGCRGLGLAMAKRFINNGAKVLITGRNEENLKSVANELDCKYLAFDITNLSSINDYLNQADALLGGANVLVNNAGISLHESTFFDVTPEGFTKQIETNLEGPFFLTQSFVRLILKRGSSANILFISSETGDTVDYRPYGFTKGAINSMVKGLAYLFKQDNIRINAIAPGITATDMTGIIYNEDLYAGNYGTGRFYLPEEVAEIAAFLISDLSSCVSGQIITCNNAQTVNPRWK